MLNAGGSVIKRWTGQALSRIVAVLLIAALVLMFLGQTRIRPQDWPDGPEAIAAQYLYNENTFIDQNQILRGGEAAVAAFSAPRSFADYEQLAEIAIAKGQYDKALPAISSCIELAAAGRDAKLLASLYLKKGCLETLTGEDSRALSSLDLAVQLNPDLAEAWLVQTEIQIRQQVWPLAAQSLGHYLQLKPEDTRLLAAQAEIQEMNGDYPGAISTYTQSLVRHQMSDPAIWLRRGSCYLQIDDFAQAAADFRQSLSLKPGNLTVQENLALCYLLLEDYESVLAIGSDVADLDQVSGEFLQHLGLSALALDRAADAESFFTQSIARQEDLSANYYYRGVSFLVLEHYANAQADFTTSIQRGEMLQLSYYNRGVCAAHLENYQLAQADMQQTLTLGEDDQLNQAAQSLLRQLGQS
ncbi:MAG: tetratricopeptide repeat protein [Clostridia bacterium]|nr:tetratricopeptide repeat protein [Clostridia bacterium]